MRLTGLAGPHRGKLRLAAVVNRVVFLRSAPGCLEQSAACIDPVLGPGGLVWSSTTWQQQPGQAFVINFFAIDGSEVTTIQKDGPFANARAVRGGR